MAMARKILIVDDNLVNRRVLEIWLTRQGHAVECAEDGAVALALLKARGAEFDLVLMDCHMPVLDGCGATRQLRQWETAQGGGVHLPVLALTAGDQSSEEECIESGMDGFLTKPLDFGRITEMMARLLPD